MSYVVSEPDRPMEAGRMKDDPKMNAIERGQPTGVARKASCKWQRMTATNPKKEERKKEEEEKHTGKLGHCLNRWLAELAG